MVRERELGFGVYVMIHMLSLFQRRKSYVARLLDKEILSLPFSPTPCLRSSRVE